MKKTVQKCAPRQVLHKAASHAILEVPQAKWPAIPVWDGDIIDFNDGVDLLTG